jgi:hypothetical protein
VILIDNASPEFNEPQRQKLLIESARKIPGRRLLIALDADEFLTSNVLTSLEWQTVLNAAPGTVIQFDWPIVRQDLSYWLYPHQFPFGFMDDGSGHKGRDIHSPRLPAPENAPGISLREIKAMHFVGIDERRWKSKIRWYQCWETLQRRRSPSKLYRFYHKDLSVPETKIQAMPRSEWIGNYEKNGIDMTSVKYESIYRWDAEVLKMLLEHGVDPFRRIDIWDIDWTSVYRALYCCEPTGLPSTSILTRESAVTSSNERP